MRVRAFRWLCVAAVTVAALAGCATEAATAGAGASPTSGEAAPFPGATVLAQGTQLRYEDAEPRFLVIRDEQAWSDFWKTHAPEGQTAGPPVDFGTAVVLVGIQGNKSSGGYSIQFRGLEPREGEVRVVTELAEPAPGQPAETAFTQPYTIVQVASGRLPDLPRQTVVFETEAGQELGRVPPTLEEDRDLAPQAGRPTDAPVAGGVGSAPFAGAAVLAQGLQLRYDAPTPQFLVIVNEEAWTAFWQTYVPEGQKAAPLVDWSTYLVLVGIQGNKSTGGYGIAFGGLEQEGSEVRVLTRLTEPGTGAIAESAFTQPYTVVQVELAGLAGRGELSFVFATESGQELGRVTQVSPD